MCLVGVCAVGAPEMAKHCVNIEAKYLLWFYGAHSCCVIVLLCVCVCVCVCASVGPVGAAEWPSTV